jgi:methionyl-tRNA formyltransferase
MSKLSNLVFFGTENFSAPALEKLIAGGWPILAVVTKPDGRGGRGQKVIVPKVKQIAQKHGIEVLQPEKLTEINSRIIELEPDLGVLVAYGKIIPQSTIDLFPGGIINVHPSLLPKYRGPAPIEAPILNGDEETGISLMRLSAGMDEGPVYEQIRVVLKGDEERPALYEKLAEQGAELLLDKLPAIAEGWLTPRPQIDAEATYTKLLKKADGQIDWSKPAEVYQRQVRAYLDFPRSRAKVGDNEIVITKARIASGESDGQLVMKSQPGWLEIQELIAPSGRKMSGADFARGYKL